jgi:hypothetical protein
VYSWLSCLGGIPNGMPHGMVKNQMLVSSNSPLPTNSQSPISADRIARQRAQMARIDSAEKAARFAVLGFCTSPKSYGKLGLNIMADAFQTPKTPVPNATTSSLVTASGSGVLDSSPYMSPPAPKVVPIDGSGDGVPNDPQFMPLTLQLTRPTSSYVCPVDSPDSFTAGQGQAPSWGDGFARPGAPVVQNAGGFVQWVKDNPLLSGALALGAIALASQGKTRQNRGRRR